MFGLNPYLAGGVLLVILSLGGLASCQHRKIGSLQTELGAVTSQLATAVSANESQSKSIDELQKANAQWASLGKTPDELKAAIGALDQQKRIIQDLADKLRRSQRDETPDCQKWRSTDLDVVCPAIASSLRGLASGSGAGPNR